MPDRRMTLAHVTHEAVEQLGGIGTVLEGMITSPAYQRAVQRSILIGPTSAHLNVDPEARLGEHGEVLYSTIDNIDRANLGNRLRPIEFAFDVKLVYGKRRYAPPGQNRTGEAEVLLIDIFHINRDRLNQFKYRLFERFGVDSSRYESGWDYEEYVRLAEPAFYALRALLGPSDLPCVLFAHEFMGMATALKAVLDGNGEMRTVFHAHECSTARKLVEDHPGHDLRFYHAMRQARAQGLYVQDVFGPLEGSGRHALISMSHLCDLVLAVGDCTAEEIRFLGPHFDDEPVELAYNGLPDIHVDLPSKLRSRSMLAQYARTLLGHEPQVLMTHVTRPVVSKGLWRDLQVCDALDPLLASQGLTAVLFILTSAGGTRRSQDIRRMEESYGWPRHHREGYPDLVGPEVNLHRDIEAFNASHQAVQVVLVNQFGWNASRIGQRLPPHMDMADFRRATDVEFGMATYEPFGISPLEPLGCGAVCVISEVCGCAGLVRSVTQGTDVPNVLIADYTHLPAAVGLEQALALTQAQRDPLEASVSREVAQRLMPLIPLDDPARERLIHTGQRLLSQMGWDQIVDRRILPALRRIVATPQSTASSAPALLTAH